MMRRFTLALTTMILLAGLSGCSKCSVPTWGFANVCTDTKTP
jgi:hypothetical protein